MREFEQDGEHIWLRQSVTFTVGGQTRTLEIAIPVRPGATADDVERLLNEADAGMERLSRHLDARVAVQTGAALLVTPTAEPAPQPSAPVSPSRPAAPEPGPATPAASSQPIAPEPTPAPTRRTAPAPSPARPAVPTPAAAPSAPQSEMTRPEFIAQISQLGLDVKQAMARLGVRSLQGLNLREALEALRRQVLQEGGAEEKEREPEPAPPPPARAAPPAHFFEEEDDEPEFTFTVNGEEGLPEEQENTASHDAVEAVEELDLDDVPDFGPAPATPRRAHTVRESPARPRAARQAPASVEPAPEATPASRAEELITEMRAARGGGTPTSYQRASYKNIVVNELGDDAAALVRGLWRVPPERLGPEQIDALISWGKRDTFADEAAEVLATLRAEQAARSGQAKNAPARGRGTTGG